MKIERHKKTGRRRAIRLIAGLGALPFAGFSSGPASTATRTPAVHWQGIALGARAGIEIHHPDPERARRLANTAQQEIHRLERIFSLYRSDSALVQLNREGRLDAPPLELLSLLSRAAAWHRHTQGAFNIALQPLWQVYARHFADPRADPAGPPAGDIAAAKALADPHAIETTPAEIRFRRRGMAVTLNGIAQGYITDRVADRLRDAGLRHVLVQLGEIRALGRHPDDRPWQVGLEPFRDLAAGRQEIVDMAVATSERVGMAFDAAARFGHILDPHADNPAWRRPLAGAGTARSRAPGIAAASVIARKASDADALSTALVAGLPGQDPKEFIGHQGIERIVTLSAAGMVKTAG